MKDYKNRFAKKIATLIVAGACSASMLFAPMAFAAAPTASVTNGGTSGTTDLTVVSNVDPEGEVQVPNDNLSYKAPTVINFVANARGQLTGPTEAVIENDSIFPIHTSSAHFEAATGWNLVADAAAATQANAVDVQVGPTGDQLDGSAYAEGEKKAVDAPAKWNMAHKGSATASDKQVALTTAGDINNVSADISSAQKFATIKWFVKSGVAS